MPRFSIFILSFLFVQLSLAQEIFKKGEHYGLKYDGAEFYAAVFDEIKIQEYFVEGRMGTVYYNLSKNKDNSSKSYRKFNYKLSDRLIVIGETTEGKIDILDETGENFHLNDGDYDKVITRKAQLNYGNDDILTVRKKGKYGLYNWVKRSEILPPVYSKIIIHESCENVAHLIYAKKGLKHALINDKGIEFINFKAAFVSDIFPSDVCDGYIIQWQHKVGYCKIKKNGKLFLIKPYYDDIYFPKGDASVIVLENKEKYGLYVDYRKALRCRYDQIQYVDEPYSIAIIEKRGARWKLQKNGEKVLIREDYVNENW